MKKIISPQSLENYNYKMVIIKKLINNTQYFCKVVLVNLLPTKFQNKSVLFFQYAYYGSNIWRKSC